MAGGEWVIRWMDEYAGGEKDKWKDQWIDERMARGLERVD